MAKHNTGRVFRLQVSDHRRVWMCERKLRLRISVGKFIQKTDMFPAYQHGVVFLLTNP